MSEHVITKGLDIPIKGRATGAPVVLEPPSTVAYSPTEFRGLTAKPAVREGDEVATGSIKGAHHIPRGFLELKIEAVERDRSREEEGRRWNCCLHA